MARLKNGLFFINYKDVNKTILIGRKQFRRAGQRVMGNYLESVRKTASKLIIPNRTGHKNPYKARKKQPNQMGRLIERTGKYKWMLKEGLNRKFTKIGNTIAKKNTSTLHLRVRHSASKTKHNSFRATIAPKVNGLAPYLRKTDMNGEKVPRESKKTIRARYSWETGLRGRTRRIFKPAGKMVRHQVKRNMLRYLKRKGLWMNI